MLPQEALRLYKDFSKGSLEIRDMSHLPHVRDGDTDSGLKDIEITGERESKREREAILVMNSKPRIYHSKQ